MDYKTTQNYSTDEITSRYQLEAMKLNYMNMRTLGDVNIAIEKLKDELSNEYIPTPDKERYQGALKALEWVTGNYKVSRNDIVNLVANMNEAYQMTIWDYIVDEDDEIIE